MPADLTYNDIEFKDVLTLEFSEAPVLDPSNTDVERWRHTLRIETIVNVDLLAEANPELGAIIPAAGNDLGTAIRQLRKALSEDRRPLVYTLDGAVMLAATAKTDLDNGPHVQHVNVTAVSKNNLRVEFGIVASLALCSDSPPPVVNNRWSLTDIIDEQQRPTRIVRGRLRAAVVPKNIHEFRRLVIPALPDGYRRVSQRIVASENALELNYEIIDRQLLGSAAPEPAYRMTAQHIETQHKESTYAVGELHVRLDGSRDSDKRKMIEAGVKLAERKLQLLRKSGGEITEYLAIVDHFGDDMNTVEVKCRVWHATGADNLGAIVFGELGKPLIDFVPDYDPDKVPTKGIYGSGSLADLFSCYLQSICEGDHSIPEKGDDATEGETTVTRTPSATPQVTYTSGTVTDYFDPPEYSSDHKAVIYTLYRIDSHIDWKFNRIHAPVARAVGLNAPSSAILDLAPPIAQRIIRLSAERIQTWPEVFMPRDFVGDTGIRYSILAFRPVLKAPVQRGGDIQFYSVDAEYRYAMDRPPKEGEDWPGGSLPWDSMTPAANRLTSQSIGEPNSAFG